MKKLIFILSLFITSNLFAQVNTGAKIFVSVNTPSGTQGFISAKTSDIIDVTSFIINSSSALDNSQVNYSIHNQ